MGSKVSPDGVIGLAEIDEVVPRPVAEHVLQVLQGLQQHLEQRSPAPYRGHPPGGEVDIGEIGEFLVEHAVKVIRTLGGKKKHKQVQRQLLADGQICTATYVRQSSIKHQGLLDLASIVCTSIIVTCNRCMWSFLLQILHN